MPAFRRLLLPFVLVPAPALVVLAAHSISPPPHSPDARPREVERYPTDERGREIATRNAAKSRIVDDLLAGRTDLAAVVRRFVALDASGFGGAAGLRARFGDRPADELAALSVLCYLENRRDCTGVDEAIGSARCEFELLFGPQVWVADPWGVSPTPAGP